MVKSFTEESKWNDLRDSSTEPGNAQGIAYERTIVAAIKVILFLLLFSDEETVFCF